MTTPAQAPETLIDPRDFGRLEAEVQQMQEQINEMREDVKELLRAAHSVRGGWQTIVTLASIGAALAALTSWFFDHLGQLIK